MKKDWKKNKLVQSLILALLLTFTASININAQDGRESDDPEIDTVVTTNTNSTTNKNAQFVAVLVPTTMTAGQKYKVGVTMRNSGESTWNDPMVDQMPQLIELQSIPNNVTDPTWGLNSVAVKEVVPPGTEQTFSFEITAPANPGSYEFKWQMAAGSQLFGESSASVVVNVVKGEMTGNTYNIDNGAAFVSQEVPSNLSSGSSYKAKVIMKNTGKTTWEPGFFWLQYTDPKANATLNELWGTAKVGLTTKVEPGQNAEFVFDIKAPSMGGTYLFNWLMGTASGTFGEGSPNVMVSVDGPKDGGTNEGATKDGTTK